MLMNDVKPIDFKSLWSGLKNYLNIRVEIFKLNVLAKGSKIIADLLTTTVLFFFVILTFLVAMVTLAFYLSSLLNNYTNGFGITALFFMLLAGLLFWRKDAFEKLFAGIVVKRYFKKHCDNEDEIQ